MQQPEAVAGPSGAGPRGGAARASPASGGARQRGLGVRHPARAIGGEIRRRRGPTTRARRSPRAATRAPRAARRPGPARLAGVEPASGPRRPGHARGHQQPGLVGDERRRPGAARPRREGRGLARQASGCRASRPARDPRQAGDGEAMRHRRTRLPARRCVWHGPAVSTRRTKIIATLGPGTDAPGRIDELVAAGMDGGRINCAHERRRRVARAGGRAARGGRAGRAPPGAAGSTWPGPRCASAPPSGGAPGHARGVGDRLSPSLERRRPTGRCRSTGRISPTPSPSGAPRSSSATAPRGFAVRGAARPAEGRVAVCERPGVDRAAQGHLLHLRAVAAADAGRARPGRPRRGRRAGGRLRGPLVRALGAGRAPPARRPRRPRQRAPG